FRPPGVLETEVAEGVNLFAVDGDPRPPTALVGIIIPCEVNVEPAGDGRGQQAPEAGFQPRPRQRDVLLSPSASSPPTPWRSRSPTRPACPVPASPPPARRPGSCGRSRRR